MARYRVLEPGLAELETPAGPMSVAASEDDLLAAGHMPGLLDPGSGALAQNDAGVGGGGNVPASRLDAGGGLGGPSAGGAPAQPLDQDLFSGAPNAPEMMPRNEALISMTKETQPLRAGEAASTKGKRGLRGGAQVEDVELGGGAALPPERARYAKVGGKDIRANYSVSKTGLSPEQIQEAEDAEGDASVERKRAAQNISERQAIRLEQQSAAFGRDLRREENTIREREERNRTMREDFDTRQRAIDDERAAVDQLKVNPNELWEGREWMQALAILGAAAGGIASATGGGPNHALEAMNRAVDRSIQVQKDKIAQRREGLRDKETELERLTKIYGSPEQAEDELRDRMRSLVQAYGQKAALDAGATDSADNLRAQFAGWDQERANSRLARQEALAGKVQENYVYQPERVVQVGGPRALKPEQRERAVRLAGGQFAFARSKGDAEKVQEQLTAGDAVKSGLSKLREVMSDGAPWDADKRGRAQALAAGLALDMKNADRAGALDAGTQEIVTKMTSDPSDFFNPAASSRIDAALERQRGKEAGLMRDYLHVDPDATQPISGARPSSVRAE